MPRLVDVAKRAGVSPMTVSRVVNNSGPVSADVRARVERALAETGYVPNTLARSLRAKRTDTLALVLTDMTNPFFTTLAHGVETAAREAGLMLVLANSDEDEDEERRVVQMLVQRQVDGILVVPAGDAADTIRQCREHGTHLVLVDRQPGSPGATDVVRADSRGGAMEIGRLLLSLGHRRVAVLAGPQRVSTAEDRVAGFEEAWREGGGEIAPHVLYGAFSIDSGREMARRALAATPGPTALFAANNFIAIGALHALDVMGIAVPDEVAVVGCDDLPQAMVTFPFLTVAAQPAYEIGRRSVALLTERLANPDGPPREIVLPTELIIRASSGRHVQSPESNRAPV